MIFWLTSSRHSTKQSIGIPIYLLQFDKQSPPFPAGFAFYSTFRLLCGVILSEEQRDTPCCRQSDQGVDDAADGAGLSAAQQRDQIELENADQSPVQTADNHQYQCDFVDKHRKTPLSVCIQYNRKGEFHAFFTLQLGENLTDWRMNDQISTAIRRSGGLVDQNQLIATVIVDQAGRRIYR